MINSNGIISCSISINYILLTIVIVKVMKEIHVKHLLFQIMFDILTCKRETNSVKINC